MELIFYTRVLAKEFFKMKNTKKLFGIIVLITVIAFSMAACGDDSSSDPFEGTWISYSDLSGAQKATVVQKGFSENFSITLNGNKFTYWGDSFTNWWM
jgi:uncharacterized lipoprotein YehR (DUF1307 family)